MYRDLEHIKDDIFSATNGGLDIFMQLFQNATTNGNFKKRPEEKTASASLHQSKVDNVWTLTDFGSGNKPMNAITTYADENGIKYVKAIVEIANNLGIETGAPVVDAKPTFKEFPLGNTPFELDARTGYYFETTDEFTKKELEILGPFVDNETCKKCNCYKVISLASEVTDKKTGAKKILQRFSTEDYPIFVFINSFNKETFYKIYQPKSKDKGFKFMFVGGRPKGFINGLSRLTSAYKPKYDGWLEQKTAAEEDGVDFKEKAPEKIEYAVICSGERDALNMTSLGFYAVWHNSETAEWTKQDFKKLYDSAATIINVPDIDATGIKQGKKLAEKFLSVETLWLPKYLSKRKDFRGNPGTDLTDFFKLNKHKKKGAFIYEMKVKIAESLPLQFWNTTVTKNGMRYGVSNTLLNNFLHHFGFYRFDMTGNRQDMIFIQVKNHLVERVTIADIFRFIDKFLKQRNSPIELRDAAITSTNISAEKLSRLDEVSLNFKNYSPKHQTFSFSHENWVIDKDGIRVSDSNNSNYTWINSVIDKNIERNRGVEMDPKKIKILDKFFDIKKTEDGKWDIDVFEKDCDFMSFVLNQSRVYWQDEFINTWKSENDISTTVKQVYAIPENEAYREANKFNLKGARLTHDQQGEQVHHFVNKIFAIGYMLHAYKDEARPWLLYAMENDVMDDDTSNGGSGKSLFFKGLSEVIETVFVAANKQTALDNDFLYSQVTKETRMFILEDLDKMANLRNVYVQVTGDLTVNVKGVSDYNIAYKDSPKFGVSSNFALRDNSNSSLRRLLITATSNYYHEEDDNLPGRQPPADFGNRRFFQNWDVEQYNKFINFLAQCVRFYLTQSKKVSPPMNSISKRNLIAQIGKTFMDFADEFFAAATVNENGHVEVNKLEYKDKVQGYHKRLSGMSSPAIAKSTDAYCKLKGYEYMPGRTRYQIKQGNKTVDYLLIYVGKDKITPVVDDDLPY